MEQSASGLHRCPWCNYNHIAVNYSVGNKKQIIKCEHCGENVWFRVFKKGVKKGWHANDNK